MQSVAKLNLNCTFVFDVNLEADTQVCGEVVVVGYGTLQEIDLTNSSPFACVGLAIYYGDLSDIDPNDIERAAVLAKKRVRFPAKNSFPCV